MISITLFLYMFMINIIFIIHQSCEIKNYEIYCKSGFFFSYIFILVGPFESLWRGLLRTLTFACIHVSLSIFIRKYTELRQEKHCRDLMPILFFLLFCCSRYNTSCLSPITFSLLSFKAIKVSD
jgi:hypothetical protein